MIKNLRNQEGAVKAANSKTLLHLQNLMPAKWMLCIQSISQIRILATDESGKCSVSSLASSL